MNNPSDAVYVGALNFLLQTCVDGQEGYRIASESVKDLELKESLSRYRLQRERFGQELKVLLGALTEPAGNEPTLTGELHHGWINLKAVVAKDDEHSILVECVRGEAGALERYGDALADGKLPREAEALVQRQSMEIKHAHEQMEFLVKQAELRAGGAESQTQV